MGMLLSQTRGGRAGEKQANNIGGHLGNFEDWLEDAWQH